MLQSMESQRIEHDLMTEQQHSYSCGGLSRVELSIELWCKDNRIQASVN